MARRSGRTTLDQRAARPLAAENPDLEYLRLSRQKICLTEINASVRLFIIDEDPISAHLLASAAADIMEALSDGKPGVGMNDMRALLETVAVSPDLSKEVFDSLKHPYNFLKHGSSDAEVENDFSVDFITMTIFNAIHSYRQLFGKLSVEMNLFYVYVQAWRIHWWASTPNFEERLHLAMQLPLINVPREEFCAFVRDKFRQEWVRM